MSFTMVVKDEASKIKTTRLEDISELSAIIRIAGNINNNINVTIENNAVARRVFKLFKQRRQKHPPHLQNKFSRRLKKFV